MTFRTSLAALFLAMISIPSAAGSARAELPPLPGVSEAGSQQQVIDREMRRERKKTEEEAEEREKAIDSPEEPSPPSGVSTAAGEDVRFTVRGVKVEGEFRTLQSKTKSLIRPYLDREISVKELQELAEKITLIYKEDGYMTTQVYVPEQDLGEDGQVKIVVATGKIGAVSVQGNKFTKPETLLRRLSSTPGSTFRYDTLRNDLQRLNRNPDRLVKAVLQPGAEPQTTDVMLDMLEDEFPLHVSSDWSNTGDRFTGYYRYSFGVRHSNLLGFDDALTGRFVMGQYDQLYAAAGDYNIPWPHSDTRFGVQYSFSRVRLGDFLEDLDIKGSAYQLTPYSQFRLFTLPHLRSNLEMGFDFKDIKVELLGEESGKDVLRVLRPRLSFDQDDKWGRTYFSNEFGMGIPLIFGASRKHDSSSTRTGGGGQFFKYVGSLVRVQRLPYSAYLIARGSTQLSEDLLVSAEQLRLGGMDTVRGYDDGEYLADYGFELGGELRTPVYFLPADLYVPQFICKDLTKWKDIIQTAGFVDYARGYLHDPQVGEFRKRNMTGVGLGLRAGVGGASFRIDWAWPIGDEPIFGGNSHVNFVLRLELP